MITLQSWVELLPYVMGAIGAIANGLLLWYSARQTAKKAAADIATDSLQAAGNLSLAMAQQASGSYQDCIRRVDALSARLDASVALNLRYSAMLTKVINALDDIMRRHEVSDDCEYGQDMDRQLLAVIKEVRAVLVDANVVFSNSSSSSKEASQV